MEGGRAGGGGGDVDWLGWAGALEMTGFYEAEDGLLVMQEGMSELQLLGVDGRAGRGCSQLIFLSA